MKIKQLFLAVTIAATALFTIITGKAQDLSPELIELGKQLTQLYNVYNDALYAQDKPRDFALAEDTMNKMFGLFNQLSDDTRKQHADAIIQMQGNLYYDKACLYSLLGKK